MANHISLTLKLHKPYSEGIYGPDHLYDTYLDNYRKNYSGLFWFQMDPQIFSQRFGITPIFGVTTFWSDHFLGFPNIWGIILWG